MVKIRKMVKDIAIYGAGGFGREIACLINHINELEPEWNLIGFFDDGKNRGETVSHFGEILGNVEDLNSYNKELAIAIAIGNPNVVNQLVSRITNSKVYFPNIIPTNLKISDKQSFSMGRGNIIQDNCIFSCNVNIGDFNIFNGSIVIGHDVRIGSFNSFMPAVRVSGEVTIGDSNFFGISSIVLQQIKIGSNVKLGAGSVLMTKPKNNSLYMGNPAKIFKY